MTDFEMYTPAGDRAVERAMTKLEAKIKAGKIRRTDLDAEVRAALVPVEMKHPEVWDTEPRDAILDRLDKACDEQGWTHLDGL